MTAAGIGPSDVAAQQFWDAPADGAGRSVSRVEFCRQPIDPRQEALPVAEARNALACIADDVRLLTGSLRQEIQARHRNPELAVDQQMITRLLNLDSSLQYLGRPLSVRPRKNSTMR